MSTSAKRSPATAARSRGSALPSTAVHPDLARGLANLLLHWRTRRDHWSRAADRAMGERDRHAEAACRANANATHAAMEDLEDMLAGRRLRERVGG